MVSGHNHKLIIFPFLYTNIKFLNKHSDEECRKRWRTLRERYTRELKRLKTSIKENSSSGSNNVTWSLFNEMSFLQDHVKLRKTRYMYEKNIKMDDDPLEDTSVYVKFKVKQPIEISATESESSRVLANEDSKEYTQIESIESMCNSEKMYWFCFIKYFFFFRYYK